MRNDWPQSLPREFYKGLGQFNSQEYFQCHETLESLWIVERGSARELHQSVIQIAVGCYHLTTRNNFRGATHKLDAGARRIERASPDDADYGVDWSALIESADRLLDHICNLGMEHLPDFDRALLPTVLYAKPLHFDAPL